MGLKSINGHILRRLIIAGANELSKNKQLVDSLNVFPVPDGDTGTNMSLTIISAAKEAEKNMSESISDIASVCASGALRGARGNSGVILSQLIRGFSKAVNGKDEIDTVGLSEAFQKAAQTAYKAVMKPKEGTILTVASSCAQASQNACLETDDIEDFLEYVIKEADETLLKTTDMLPALKEAGVVDAGGKGLLFILKGALYNLKSGSDAVLNTENKNTESTENIDISALSTVKAEDIKFGYCTEFFILKPNAAEKELDDLKEFLLSMGDSLMLVSDDEVIKVHVHTNHPGLVIEKALKMGALNGLKIDNMRIQHTNKIDFSNSAGKNEEKSEPKKRGFISVSAGSGFDEIFKNIGVDYVITGGQTMNPSTEDILKAIDKVNAETIFVLPNNKNIILASQQAAKLTKDKNIIVIGTKSVPEGISAMLNYDDSMTDEEIKESMEEGMEYIKTLSVTFAVRDTVLDGKEIHEGDFIGMLESSIVSVENEVAKCTEELIKSSVDDDAEVVTIYYGEDVNESDAEKIKEYVETEFDHCEVELHYGGQPLYYYLISVE